jgi:hypothetical protein
MDISAASQWSSGCESGWTRYLEQPSLSENQFHRVGGTDEYGGKEARVGEKEEDLSLVSDASSGPSHYHEDDEECFHDNGCHFNYSEVSGKSKKKKKAKELHGRNRRHSDLDDTASYPALSFPLQASSYNKFILIYVSSNIFTCNKLNYLCDWLFANSAGGYKYSL